MATRKMIGVLSLVLSASAFAQVSVPPQNVDPITYQVLVSTSSLQIVSYGQPMPLRLNVAMASNGLAWLMTSGADAQAPAALLVAQAPAQISIGNGRAYLLVDPASTATVFLSANSLGGISVPVDFSDPQLLGITVWMQTVSLSGGVPGLSNGLYIHFGSPGQLGSAKTSPANPAQTQGGPSAAAIAAILAQNQTPQ